LFNKTAVLQNTLMHMAYVLNFNVGSVWCLYLFSYCAPRLYGLFE
jgi:hypothetical protein